MVVGMVMDELLDIGNGCALAKDSSCPKQQVPCHGYPAVALHLAAQVPSPCTVAVLMATAVRSAVENSKMNLKTVSMNGWLDILT